MTNGETATSDHAGGGNFNETGMADDISPEVKFLREFPNHFSRLTRYIHNSDMKRAINTANELKALAIGAGAPKISDMIVSIKNALYEGNAKKASALLDEINFECSRYFMKIASDE